MSIRKDHWIRIEGPEIQDLYKEYGTFVHLPNELQHIYYKTPEFQMDNPFSTTNSTIYKFVSIKNYYLLEEINLIDQHWGTGSNLDLKKNIEMALAGQDMGQVATVDINNSYTGIYIVGQPITIPPGIEGSCVIFYGPSDLQNVAGARYSNYCIVLVDEHATPRVVKIKAEYTGPVIPVNTPFNEDDLKVYAVYDDGNEIKIDSGYTIDPSTKLVTNLGENVFNITYIDAEYDANVVDVVVEGCRNLQGIRAEWEGQQVAWNKPIDTKFITVIAYYSDGFEQTVTDYTFPNGNTVTKVNEGVIDIYYQGKECTITVPTFEVKKQRLIATYMGPKVEVGRSYLDHYINVKMYYQSADEVGKAYYEDIPLEECTLDEDKEVKEEGINSFEISYEGILGLETTTFSVIGMYPIVIAKAIDVSYTGPGVLVGKALTRESIICNVHYSDGSTSPTDQYSMSTNIVQEVGENEITITFQDKYGNVVTDILVVTGLDTEQTTENNIFPTDLVNNYPKATILNNRYRGPAEGLKMDATAKAIISNIKELYEIYALLEKQYNDIIRYVEGQSSTKVLTLNNVNHIDKISADIINDKHYSTGVYKRDDIIR